MLLWLRLQFLVLIMSFRLFVFELLRRFCALLPRLAARVIPR